MLRLFFGACAASPSHMTSSNPPPDSAFAAALAGVVARRIAGATAIADLTRLSGGASQETWTFVATGADVSRRMVLRRSSGDGGARLPLATEAALMTAAGRDGVPSPRVVHVLTPQDGLGDGFLMDHVPGETIARKLLRDAAFAVVRQRLAREAGAILARLHAIDVAALPALPVLSAVDELAELHRSYEADGQSRPVYELAFRWLRTHAPSPPSPTRLVHGDFRTGNLIVGPDGIRAVLDWELACLGDPVRDLGWFCTPSWRFGAIDQPAGGFGAREDLLAGYAGAGGRRVSMDELAYWETFGSLRWGVYCLTMRARAAGGDRVLERAMIARRASECEIDLLRALAPRRR